MKSYTAITKEEAQQELERLENRYESLKAEKLQLDMTRGKPSPAQLDMIFSLGIESVLDDGNYRCEDGGDARNYGCPKGIPEARRLFAEILNTQAEKVIVLNNSSLNIMYDAFVRALLFPLPGSKTAWGENGAEKVKVLCPAPGYDRHFNIAASFGCELIYVPMNEDGPDMDAVERLARDHAVKAMFAVPIYSNPDGYVFPESVCRRLAAMKAAEDFRIFWDNAYAVHNLNPAKTAPIYDMLAFCAEAGHPNRVFTFASTSKMTFAGSGVSCLASSPENLDWFARQMKYQTIGPDKVNQLRHVRFFVRNGGYQEIMRRQAESLAPKFKLVLDKLNDEFAGTDLLTWHEPEGGYFISINVQDGLAGAVVSLSKSAGVALTPAGATFPNGYDPRDRNIRLAPSYPSFEELAKAMDALCLCVRICTLRKILA